MEIPNCIDDFRKTLVFLPLVAIAEIMLCLTLSWNLFAVIACVIWDILLCANCLVDWIYLRRTIILDRTFCIFISGKRVNRFSWQEVNIQYVDNTGYLFGDSEISGPGVIISTKPIQKPTHIGAMTYCRFFHPNASVFIRFISEFDSLKISSAKFVYQGFSAEKSEIMAFLKETGS